MSNSNQKEGQTGFRETLKSDIRQRDLSKTMRQDYREVREFFLTDAQRDQLLRMNWFKKIFVLPFWLFRAMYMRLTPARRLLLLVGLFFTVFARASVNAGDVTISNGHLIGALIFLFILLMELKDKIVARDELQAGRAVQTALMPPEAPEFENWDIWTHTCPANDVGGDLVDYLPVGEERLGLSLGDVAGKGLGAALFMAKLQATLRALAPGRSTIDALGGEMNGIFERDGIPNRFASLVYLEITPGSGTIHFLNAGHMPPLHLHDGNVEELPRGGPALGIVAKAEYDMQTVTLAPGDTLCVYSDGLTEARNMGGEFFGEERFRKLLGQVASLDPSRMGDHILQRIRRFTDEASQHDDISLLILRYAPGQASTSTDESHTTDSRTPAEERDPVDGHDTSA